ncbi:MAG: glycosyltransferase [Solirubrobacteraceae bacterium]|nr:glycosyltransferase [Solirubrobacteraceae bacterium]
MRRPLLLLPRPLDQFVLGDHARELVEAGQGAVALAGKVPYGALVRAPGPTRGGVASMIARHLTKAVPSDWSADETVIVAYHAIQWPAAMTLLDRGVASELWYCRWDRYEAAHDAGKPHQLLGAWHEAMAERSSLTFAVSGKLAELEQEAGRDAIVVGLSADAFPSGPLDPGGRGRGAELVREAKGDAGPPAASGNETAISVVDGGTGSEPHAPHERAAAEQAGADSSVARGDGAAISAAASPIAVSLGHLGHRTDWAWLRGAIERLEDLQLLLIGAWHDDEVDDDPDYRWLRGNPQVVWLGALDDADAAAVIAEADVGLVPFLVEPFNDAGLPTRILKYARLGRPTLAPPLAGARTWERATTFVEGPGDLASALRQRAGLRFEPDADLRAWALDQTAARMNAPLHERLQR